MKTEQITITKLVASDGMILTNGTTYGRVIFLANGENPILYYEITEARYNEIMAEEAEKVEA